MMERKTFHLMWVLLLGVLLAGCSAWPRISIQPRSDSKTSARVIFQDDFKNLLSGWSTINNGSAAVGYDSGGLRILINQLHTQYWSNPGLKLTDVLIDVDAEQASGPENNFFGVICRYQNENNYTAFLISSDGYYGISRVLNGTYQLLGSEAMMHSDQIKTGLETNHLTVLCAGDRLSLAVNGNTLQVLDGQAAAAGDVGLLAGTYDSPGVDILFKNFVVTQP